MVLSDRLSTGGTPPSLFKKTILYVLSFGLGALLVAGTLGLVMTSVADALLPGKPKTAQADAKPGKPGVVGKGPSKGRTSPGSKAKPSRGNEGADAAK